MNHRVEAERHMMIPGRLCVAMAALALAGCATRTPPPPAYDPDTGLATFDAAWRIVHEQHYDTTYNGVDWPGLRDALRPEAAAAASRDELRLIIRRMLERLGQSHFALIDQDAADALDPAERYLGEVVGDVGLDVRLIGDDIVVTRVDRGGPAERAGVRTGWAIDSVGTRSAQDVIARLRTIEGQTPLGVMVRGWTSGMLRGVPDTEARIVFRDGENHSRPVTVRRTPMRGEAVKLGHFPTFFAVIEHDVIPLDKGGTAGLIWFSPWMAPLMRELDSAVWSFDGADGIVIDVRGNPGGALFMIAGAAGHFFDATTELGTMQTRTTTLRLNANPRRVDASGRRITPFAGPVAVLVDQTSASASEAFAGGLRAVGRARVFGETTAGAVLPAAWARLPNGDVLYYAMADFITADGTRLEGVGVVPDEPVAAGRTDYLAGRDPVLEAALAWIAAEKAASLTGASP